MDANNIKGVLQIRKKGSFRLKFAWEVDFEVALPIHRKQCGEAVMKHVSIKIQRDVYDIPPFSRILLAIINLCERTPTSLSRFSSAQWFITLPLLNLDAEKHFLRNQPTIFH